MISKYALIKLSLNLQTKELNIQKSNDNSYIIINLSTSITNHLLSYKVSSIYLPIFLPQKNNYGNYHHRKNLETYTNKVVGL